MNPTPAALIGLVVDLVLALVALGTWFVPTVLGPGWIHWFIAIMLGEFFVIFAMMTFTHFTWAWARPAAVYFTIVGIADFGASLRRR